MTTVTIDLADHGGPIYNGRARGEALRQHFGLDGLDFQRDNVVLIVPPEIQAITNSFVGGLFAPSIQQLGSRDRFFEHFTFRWPEDEEKRSAFSKVIEHEIRRALFDKKPLMS